MYFELDSLANLNIATCTSTQRLSPVSQYFHDCCTNLNSGPHTHCRQAECQTSLLEQDLAPVQLFERWSGKYEKDVVVNKLLLIKNVFVFEREREWT